MSNDPLPRGWVETPLSHVVPKAQYGISVPLGDHQGIPILRMNNLREGSVDLTELAFSSSAEAARLTLEPNDVLFNRTNSIEHVGRTSLWRGELDIASFASYLVRLVPDDSRLDPEYLVRWLNLADTQLMIRQFATPGVHQVNINPTNLRRTPIRFPDSLPEQRRIAEILSTLDDTIEQTEALIAKYQQIKAGLMQDLFTRGVTPDGRLRPTCAQAAHHYKESPLGWVPKEWELASIGQCIDGIDAGKSPECPDTPATGDQWGVLKVGAVHPEGLRERENKTVLEKRLYNPAFLVRENDLLLSRANTFDLVGLVCHVTGTPRSLMLSDKTLRLRANPTMAMARFMFWSLQTPLARRQIENAATGTSGSMKNISQSGVRAIRLARPHLPEQGLISLRLDGADNVIGAMRTELAKLRQQRLGLMHDLLTGHVRVKLTDSEEVLA